MKPKEAYFIVDTNALIQCRWLDEVEWSDVTDSNEVRLIICRPVQREIDNLKGSPGRRGKRARKIHSIIRQLLLSDIGHFEIRDGSPLVCLSLDLETQPDHNSSTKPDDQIVACLQEYRQRHPEHQARLLTHDSGPIATVQHHDLPFAAIPESWLLPLDPGADKRQIAQLKSKIRELEAREPRFEITVLPSDEQQDDVVSIEIPEYRPFTDQEIDQLIDSMSRLFPVKEDFSPANPEKAGETRKCDGNFDLVYQPPDKAQIQKYQKEEYPAWLERCRTIFRDLHKECQQLVDTPWFYIEARNTGTRPASNVLVSMEASGNFWLFTPNRRKRAGEESEDDHKRERLRLPEPPKPPEWTWRLCLKADSDLDFEESQPASDQAPMDIREALRANLPSLLESETPLLIEPHIHCGILQQELQRDPEGFYWRIGSRGAPLKFQSFECQRWRHATEAEEFSAQIWVPDNVREISGAVNFRIEAENLSEPFERAIPVRISKIEVPPMLAAEELIKELASSSGETE